MHCERINPGYLALLCCILFFGSALKLTGQEEVMIDGSFGNKPWKQSLQEIKRDHGLNFYFLADSIPDFTFQIDQKKALSEALIQNFGPYGIEVSMDAYGNVYLVRGARINTAVHPEFYKAVIPEALEKEKEPTRSDYLNTNKVYIPQTVVVGTRKEGIGKNIVKVTGRVINSEDRTPIINGTIYIEETEKGTVTNDQGEFTLDLPKGSYTLKVNSIESTEKILKVIVYSDGALNIELEPELYLLEEIVVRSDRHHNVRGTQMGFEKIDTKKIKEIPVVLGERDIIKVALLLPGVQSVGEGTSGFNVRGSPADQNLFYINRVPVYNTSHLFGFFSAFNADAINDFSLLKSNIPAEYGGRLASIFDIHARDGNMEKFSMRGGISPVTGSLLIESPIVKNKSSFLVSARSTYSNWLLTLVDDPTIHNSKAYFGDGIANLTFKLNDKNELRLFTYYSYDDANIADLTNNKYQNVGGAVSWHRLIKNKHTLDLSFTSALYSFENNNMEYDFAAYQQTYDLNHNELKANFNFRPNERHTINFGVSSTLYRQSRGDFLPLNESSLIEPITFEPEQGLETGLFIGDNWIVTPDLEIIAGIRYNIYSYLGPKTVYQYIPGYPRETDYITDTVSYGKNKGIATYGGLDYRVAAKYLIDENWSVKGSYNRLHQYIFMLSNTIAISPTDIWKLSDAHIKPMVGDQYSLGFYTNIMGGFLEASVEGYYKEVSNLVEYKDGADLVINEIPETEIVQGDLDAWGVEFMLRKPDGKLNGWINYTYSRAEVLVNNPSTGEQNNFGIRYPANYDKPHALNLVANYRISKRLNFSGNIVYSTGRPITYPTAIYYQNGMQITNYSLRNEYRLPDYFRVDVSMNFEGNLKRNKLIHGSWSVSVYNLTGRRNAYSVYFKSESGVIKGYRLSIFGVPIFSISYNFKLGNYDD
jgi:hypothetical protein